MFNEKDILDCLHQGKSVDEIAAAFTKAINSANETFIQEQKNLKTNVRKSELIDTICKALTEYIELAAPGLSDYLEENDEMIDPVEIRKNLDTSIELMLPLIDVAKNLKNNVPVSTNKSDQDIIDEFVKKFIG